VCACVLACAAAAAAAARRLRTRFIEGTHNPVWNERHEVYLADEADTLKISVKVCEGVGCLSWDAGEGGGGDAGGGGGETPMCGGHHVLVCAARHLYMCSLEPGWGWVVLET
jgi:hypothetical protein